MSNGTRARRAFGLLFLALGVTSMRSARADSGPDFVYLPGNVSPVKETQVEMIEETVSFESGEPSAADGERNATESTIFVDAEFALRNTSLIAETIQMFFPFCITHPETAGPDSRCDVADISVELDGASLPFKRTEIESRSGGMETRISFRGKFPPGVTRQLVVKYRLDEANRRQLKHASVTPFHGFDYFLHSGAGWKGAIGHGKIVVIPRYTAESWNTVLVQGGEELLPSFDFTRKSGRLGEAPPLRYENGTMIYEFDELEPSAKDDFSIWILAEEQHRKVLELKRKSRENANDLGIQMKYAEALLYTFDGSVPYLDAIIPVIARVVSNKRPGIQYAVAEAFADMRYSEDQITDAHDHGGHWTSACRHAKAALSLRYVDTPIDAGFYDTILVNCFPVLTDERKREYCSKLVESPAIDSSSDVETARTGCEAFLREDTPSAKAAD